MNTVLKSLSLFKIILLIGLCLYMGLSALFYIYLQIRFFDPIYFQKIAIRILAVGLIWGLNLSLSVRHVRRRNQKRPQSLVSYLAAFLCSAAGCLIFLNAAINGEGSAAWFFSCYSLVILLISAYEIIAHKQ